MESKFDEDDLFLAGLEILESRKAYSKSTFCLSCEEQMKVSSLLICSECLSEECSEFEKISTSIITKGDAKKAQNKLIKLLNHPDWLRGIGLSSDEDNSFFVKINVFKITNGINKLIPGNIDGVPIKMYEVGDIVAY
jgi:hypothetical protein